MSVTREFEITRVKNGAREQRMDIVIREHRLTIYVNDLRYVTLLCMDQELEALVIGHMLNEGFIRSMSDILRLEVKDREAWVETVNKKTFLENTDAVQAARTVTTGCGNPHSAAYYLLDAAPPQPLETETRFSLSGIQARAQSFQADSEVFLATGGVHSCALCSADGELIYFMEDIGRHNAFDKVAGAALRDGVALEHCCLVTSGRVPSDMLIKAINARIPLVVSRSAPTDAAIEMARQYRVTLCGFARETRMNIYSFPDRLV